MPAEIVKEIGPAELREGKPYQARCLWDGCTWVSSPCKFEETATGSAEAHVWAFGHRVAIEKAGA